MTRIDRLLRWVWLINGVLLLLLLLGGAVFVAIGALAGRGGGAPEAAAAAGDSARAGALRFDPPQPVRGGTASLVLIRRGARGAAVNVAFVRGDSVRLLLPRNAWIRRVVYPGAAGHEHDAEGLRWIVYELAAEDGDGSGGVDEHDPRSLYVTDLEGRGLRRVLPPGVELSEWVLQPDGALVVNGLELGGRGAPRQRAFRLQPDGTIGPWTALDSVVAAAARR